MKYILRAFCVAALLFAFAPLHAQQEQHNAHNMFNQVSYNPGFTGSIGGICATGLVRQQWVGFKDEAGNNVAPQSYSVNIHSPLNILHGGIGASIYQDQLGFQKEIGVKLLYAYRKDIGMGNLGVGVQVGFINGSIDFASLYEGARDKTDPLLSQEEKSDMLLDFGFGVHYFVPEKFYVGVSTTRISEQQSTTLSYNTTRHYYFNAGYEFAFPGNSSYVLEPSILIKSDLVKTQYDIATLLKYNNRVWGGVSYSAIRNMDPFSVLLGLKIKDVRVGYAYTIPTSKIGSSGSHEIMIGYCFKVSFDRGRESYKNTRFL
ncbi:MAG: PorP/SprF family type IX secretion system membrane protein [Bacteroidales bacterium]|nr:PorP/SprF family type IX secretion system membrane protein [Bacteroidales bacterium]